MRPELIGPKGVIQSWFRARVASELPPNSEMWRFGSFQIGAPKKLGDGGCLIAIEIECVFSETLFQEFNLKI